MTDIYLATGNAHKLEEFSAAVSGLGGWRLRAANDVGGMPEVDETGDTFEENALLKARALVGRVPEGAYVLADDSGLVVDALGGAPGVYSARYAGPGADDAANRRRLLTALREAGSSNGNARFRCVLCLLQAGAQPLFFSGSCEGSIIHEERGSHGFGYDPLFVPLGFSETFAELTMAEKQELSHRGAAIGQLSRYLRQRCAE
jgi:XTP/dITP diphosphohydrolase